MKQFLADSNYHQFYVADRELEPDTPTKWTDEDVEARHLTLENISALCPESDIDARITSCGPNELSQLCALDVHFFGGIPIGCDVLFAALNFKPQSVQNSFELPKIHLGHPSRDSFQGECY